MTTDTVFCENDRRNHTLNELSDDFSSWCESFDLDTSEENGRRFLNLEGVNDESDFERALNSLSSWWN